MMLLERLDIAAKKIVILIGVENGFPQEFIIYLIKIFHMEP
jgi:hypothetical protein